jgi:hypothetical protein
MPVHRTRVHVIVSFVATGHVLFIEADTRRMVECICTSPGVNTIRQAHTCRHRRRTEGM